MVTLLLQCLAGYWPLAPKGQGLIEYALIMILVSVVLVVLLVVFGPGLGNIYSSIVNAV